VLTPPPLADLPTSLTAMIEEQATIVSSHGTVQATVDSDATFVSNPASTLPDLQATVVSGPSGTSIDDLVTMPPGSPPAQVSIDGPSDSGPLKPGQTFSARYHIIRPLGVGGMGAVYQAWDAELGEAVAIKVIRPEVMADPIAALEIERRFKRELQLARQVTHKNVIRIHDLGEIDGIKYITMSYVDGTDLATVLKRDGALDVTKTLTIVRPIVAGLTAAHAAGVVHRDLKPANIMIGSDGEAYLMDFGIARSIAGSSAGRGTVTAGGVGRLRTSAVSAVATMAGAVVGTVPYMAPEQAHGGEVDQRADIYALGLIMYDMLVGRRRLEHATSAVTELEARIEHGLPSVKSILPGVPEPLNAIVSRCIEVDPAKRFQATTEIAAELDRLDEHGELIPVKRTVGVRLMTAIVVALLALSGGAWWYGSQAVPPPPRDPIAVLIADFQNTTGDVTLNRTLEPVLKLALEGANFISAYDRSAIGRIGVANPPDNLDERSAQEIAVKQAVGIVLAGSVGRQGDGYSVSMRATQAVTGEVITEEEDVASSKDQVLAVSTDLATRVRRALGDDTSDSAQRFAMETLTATSLEAVHDYANGQLALSNNRNEEAIKNFSQAVGRDPDFGAAYSGMSIAYRNMGEQQNAEKFANEAVRHLDRMTERERYRARGLLYYLTSDYQACVKEYGDLIARYAADVAARNNLALCLTYLRDMPRARSEMQSVVKILPRRALYRLNLSLYATYGSDFEIGLQEARAAQELGSPLGPLALAFAQLGLGQVTPATQSYQALAKVNALGASQAASGLGDLAAYEGRFSDAVSILEQGAAADLASKNVDRAAAKFAALANTRLMQGQRAAANRAAEQALKVSNTIKVRFLAARIFVETGEIDRARELAAGLSAAIQAEPQALGKVIEGNLALKAGNARDAITRFTEAAALQDTWIGRFDLGRAYLEVGAYLQADSEFDRCIKRRGEAMSLFLDEEPTFSYLPPVYYYQGRVREQLKSIGFVDSYRAYLDIREKAGQDPLLSDVRRRAGS
jgi:tetratricopeptide (TPR) repeat protein